MPKAKVKAEIIKQPETSNTIKRSAWESVFESLAVLILGIFFVVWPENMTRIVAYVVGTFFMVKGALQIINYFIHEGQHDFFNNDLLFGVVSALIGIVVFVLGGNIVNVLRIVVGIFLVYESLVRMNTAIKFSAAGISVWRYVLILALIILALGIFVITNDVATIIGWTMVVAGIVSLISDVLFIQYLNKLIEAWQSQFKKSKK